MCDPVSATMAFFGAVGAYSQQKLSKKAAEGQDAANRTATANAATAADQADQANNKANGKSADLSAMGSANSLAAKGGVSGTMLTGSQGVDPSALMLGKTTLLGA